MDKRKQNLITVAAIIRRRCPRIAKDHTEFPDINWCAEHLVRSFEKAEEAVFHSRQHDIVNSIWLDLQSAIQRIENLNVYNRSFLVQNFSIAEGDPDLSKPATVGFGRVTDQEELFKYRLRNVKALRQTVKKLNTRLRHEKDRNGKKLFGSPVTNQNLKDYQAAMLAGGCRKIWHEEKQKPKPMKINSSRNHELGHFIDDVFDAFGLNDHVKSIEDKRINPGSALDAFNRLTKDGKGVAL